MQEITYITGNKLKFEIGQKALEGFGIKLVQQELKMPEIQSDDVGEVASYSAKWASEKLNKPVIVTDVGYYIEALKGFPGPFIKYINQWLTSADILKLMNGQESRSVEVKACLAYCEHGKEPAIFLAISKGTIALTAGKKGVTPIDEIFIPEEYDKPESEIEWEERSEFWSKEQNWPKLAEYLRDKNA
jgi:XTP/dITP diphosphohydrolase